MTTLWALLALTLLPVVLGFPSGAPTGACGHLTPGHRANQTVISPQAVQSPYTISVSSDTYATSGTLTVSITGESFRGILLHARLADDTVVGTFSSPPTDTQLIQCTNADDSVTHLNTNSKSAGTEFTWNAPATDVGPVTFTATVLQEFEIFWVKLTSEDVSADSGAAWISVNVGLLTSLLLASFIFVK